MVIFALCSLVYLRVFLPCVYDEMHIRHDARRETAGTRQEPMVPVPGDEPLLTGFFLDRVDIR